MRVLVSTSRMPVAIDEIRKFARVGHEVIACDTFAGSPGNHSRLVSGARLTASPRHDPHGFAEDVAEIIKRDRIDCVVPAFEEVVYLARFRDKMPDIHHFYPSFETVTRLHNKATLLDVAHSAGIAVPRSIVVTTRHDLMAATREMSDYVAKPVFSRGGISIATNVGPLAHTLPPSRCHPTPERPWIVQEYVHGEDVCSFSVVQRGRVTAHVTYVHPREIEHAGGIVFESIDEPRALRAAEAIAEVTKYHGQLSFDYRRSGRGLVLIECNPRPTAGVHLMSAEMLGDAMEDRKANSVRVVPRGTRRMYAIALIRDAILHPAEARESLRHLFSDAREVVFELGDPLPAVEQVFSYRQVIDYLFRHHEPTRKNTALMAAYFDDVCWDGQPIAEDRSDMPPPSRRSKRQIEPFARP